MFDFDFEDLEHIVDEGMKVLHWGLTVLGVLSYIEKQKKKQEEKKHK